MKKLDFKEMEMVNGGESPYLCASIGLLAGVVTANPFVGFTFAAACIYACQ